MKDEKAQDVKALSDQPSYFILHPSSFASSIISARPSKNPVDSSRPYAYITEPERTADGRVEQVATVFLTNRECPFRCLFCDLWKNTTDERVPVGAIPAQIDFALARLPAARHIKLYNSGNFFDPQAIPPEDFGEIARRVRGFRTVIVENHPRLCGESCLRFRDKLQRQWDGTLGTIPSAGINPAAQSCETHAAGPDSHPPMSRGVYPRAKEAESMPHLPWLGAGVEPDAASRNQLDGTEGNIPSAGINPAAQSGLQLEVALGLETIHPATLARLNKQMTVADFDRAVEFLLTNSIAVRAFILLRPPGQSEEEGVEWALRSIEHAQSRGVRCCSVIPVRGGNGIMEQLAANGDYTPPRLSSLEKVLESTLHSSFGNRHSTIPPSRVFVDLWDAARFSTCPYCVDRRLARLHGMNLSQTVLPKVECFCS